MSDPSQSKVPEALSAISLANIKFSNDARTGVSPSNEQGPLEMIATNLVGSTEGSNDGEKNESVGGLENKEEADADISDTEPGAINGPDSQSGSICPSPPLSPTCSSVYGEGDDNESLSNLTPQSESEEKEELPEHLNSVHDKAEIFQMVDIASTEYTQVVDPDESAPVSDPKLNDHYNALQHFKGFDGSYDETVSHFSDSTTEPDDDGNDTAGVSDEEQDHNRFNDGSDSVRDSTDDGPESSDLEYDIEEIPLEVPKYKNPSQEAVRELEDKMYRLGRPFECCAATLILDLQFRREQGSFERMAATSAVRDLEMYERRGRRRNSSIHETFVPSKLSGASHTILWPHLSKVLQGLNKGTSPNAYYIREASDAKYMLAKHEQDHRALRISYDETARELKNTRRIVSAQKYHLDLAQDQLHELKGRQLISKSPEVSAASADKENVAETPSKELEKYQHTIQWLTDKLERNETVLLTTQLEARHAKNRLKQVEGKNKLVESNCERLKAQNNDLLQAFAKREIDFKKDGEVLKKALEESKSDSSNDSINRARLMRVMDSEFVPVARHSSAVELLHEKNTGVRELNHLVESSIFELESANNELSSANDENRKLRKLLEDEREKYSRLESQDAALCSKLKEVGYERDVFFTQLQEMGEPPKYAPDCRDDEIRSLRNRVKTLLGESRTYKTAQADHEKEIQAKDEELQYAYEYCTGMESQLEARAEKDGFKIRRLEDSLASTVERLSKAAHGTLQKSEDFATEYDDLKAEHLKVLRELSLLKLDKVDWRINHANQEQATKEAELSEMVMLKVKVAELLTESDSSSVSTTGNIAMIQQHNAALEERDTALAELAKAENQIANLKAKNDKLSNAEDVKRELIAKLQRLEEVATDHSEEGEVDYSSQRQHEAMKTMHDVFKTELTNAILEAGQVREDELPNTVYELLVLYLGEKDEQLDDMKDQVSRYRQLARSDDQRYKFAANRELELQKVLALLGKNRAWLMDSVKSMFAGQSRPDANHQTPVNELETKPVVSKGLVKNWLRGIKSRTSAPSIDEASETEHSTLEEKASEPNVSKVPHSGFGTDIQTWVGKFLIDSDRISSAGAEDLAAEVKAGTDKSALRAHLH